MKRPLFVLTIAAVLFAAILFCLPASNETVIIAVLIALLALLVAAGIFHAFLTVAVAAVLIFVAVESLGYCRDVKRINDTVGDAFVSAVVTEIDYNETQTKYLLDCNKINGSKCRLSVYAVCEEGMGLSYGDRVLMSLRIENVGSKIGRSRGVCANSYVIRLYEWESASGFHKTVAKLRSFITGRLFSSVGYDSAAMLSGILLGNRDFMSEKIYENTKDAGVSHVTVVSGLHLSILAGSLLVLLKKYRISGLPYALLGLGTVCGIIVLSGFTPSVMRAGLTWIFVFAGILLYRRSDALNSLLLAVLLCVFFEPFIIGNLSFQLSAVSTFAVIVVAPRVYRLLSGKGIIMSLLFSAASITLSATVFTMPFLLATYGTLSTISVLSNLLITYAVTAALTLAAMGVVLTAVPFISNAIMLLCDLVTRYIIFIINLLGAMPYAHIELPNPTAAVVISTFAALALGAYFLKYHDEGVSPLGNSA